MKANWEEIIVLGGEGGSITLYGLQKDGNWLFCRERNESALASLLDEEDWHLLTSQSECVGTWEEALALIEPYWMFLSPMHVHPAFREKMWTEVQQRGQEVWKKRGWERICVYGRPY
ncbi:hypothetical protein [Ectobacillus ponti]|uniref:Uncharacterized protein n=1 Tax=Ectobacillus ponti TaxID=2961894 RepID=A0AA41X6X6_9BACI|nr:hypothetical protein [Ectobacillus ponti]MCP8969947.1 hypothetical protein [Ectobacillus ponti]